MSLMEQFSNPETIHSLSFGEKMIGSSITMLMGLGITFMVLILIWIFIVIMGKCLGATQKKEKKAPAPVEPAAPSAAQVTPETSDDSLIAVIAAAVAAYTGANANRLVVKKIARVSGEQTPWGASGLEDRLDTRKV